MKPSVAALAGETLFSGVADQAGQAVSVGRYRVAAHWLGLAGNPFRPMFTWQVFGMALVRGLTR